MPSSENVLERSIEEVGLSAATAHALWHRGLTTVGSVTQMSAVEIKELPVPAGFKVGIGDSRITEIRSALRDLGLALKGEPVMFASQYRADLVAQALVEVGVPGIIMCRVDNDTFALTVATHEGGQLFLKRPPARTESSALEIIEVFEQEGYRFYYNPPMLDVIAEEYDWELFDRSRIKSLWMFDVDKIRAGQYVDYNADLFGSGNIGVTESDPNMTFTGKHWFFVERPAV